MQQSEAPRPSGRGILEFSVKHGSYEKRRSQISALLKEQ
jgi:hypothetical protein